jgi:predicted AAA+ superfamily ATPase
MAISNYDRVTKVMDLLKAGLQPFVEREMKAQHSQLWLQEARASVAETQAHLFTGSAEPEWDAASLLAVMWNQWEKVFRKTLGRAERSLISELRDIRNKWAHQSAFSSDDAYRALDSAGRLLTQVSATAQVDDIDKLKTELLRVRFDEQARSEKRKAAGTAIEGAALANLKPWREVVTPHKDVASGRYQQAEFAADLWQVYLGEGTDEYKKPVEFFRRTYLTESLKQMLVGAVRRINGQGGDPVVQLQTNFGGGKTHSMLALYHLFSGTKPSELSGIDAVLQEAGTDKLPAVRRVVLVGNKISPGNPVKKADGTIVRTLWGELAWQLGGKKAFDRIRADDEKATSPGDALRELFNEYGPSLVLIDEWVAYARQLHDQSDLPAGGFETQFTFAQTLTEAARAAKNCLLVISLPASDTGGSPHTQADDVEVGGQRGREALDRLRNVIGRLESSWRPASAEEGFEIVRRRLFEPLINQTQFTDRDVVARAFADLYRTNQAEFPPECSNADYEKRIRAAYPIHPEIFDRLYTDWSTLVKFQRTRGVLRLMAAVIHSLWEKGDKNPLILPANISIDDSRVQFELTRYLSDNWTPIIEKDVDGPSSLPLRLDGELPNLGKFSACRRVARTIYLGSAPTATAAHLGIEERRVKLGCVMPGESAAVFGDALRRLAAAATFLYQDGPRYWYSTQPTVTKLAEDRAEQLKRDTDKVVHELDKRVRENLRKMGDFKRVHPIPGTSADVPDDLDTRLVVLGVDHAYTKEPNSAAETFAKTIFETRGTTPRLFRNTLIFLAADKTRLQDLDEAVRKFLAWQSILAEKEKLDLSPHQVTQAQTQFEAADGAVTARLPETFQWLLVPTQGTPQAPVTWQTIRLTGTDPLAERASKKLKNDESLLVNFAASRLRMEMDRVPLWRGNAVAIRQLIEDFGRYLYLPRLQSPAILVSSIQSGLALLTWEKDAFAYAESYDELKQRYRGLKHGGQFGISADDTGLLVKPDVARQQIDAETAPTTPPGEGSGSSAIPPIDGVQPTPEPPVLTQPPKPRRYHGTVALDPARVGRDASRIADEVVTHLVGLVGTNVKITLEIDADIPAGVPDNVVRTVTENSRTLKFESNSGFERE